MAVTDHRIPSVRWKPCRLTFKVASFHLIYLKDYHIRLDTVRLIWNKRGIVRRGKYDKYTCVDSLVLVSLSMNTAVSDRVSKKNLSIVRKLKSELFDRNNR